MYNYEMIFFKVWAIFNFIITIFNIIKFHSFFENLTPVKPWFFILICICIIILLIKLNFNINSRTNKFDFIKEKNYPLYSYLNSHYENSDFYALFLLCFLHFGINAIFLYALFNS